MTGLLVASAAGNAAAAAALLRHHARVEQADADGRRSLMLAARAGSTACVAVLLASGASADAATPGGWRSAMFADARGDAVGRETLAMLRAAGAVELSETESAMAAGFSEEEVERALQAVADAQGPPQA